MLSKIEHDSIIDLDCYIWLSHALQYVKNMR
jgi:hypothetical protein